jgi:protein-disulfide isomerase
MTTAWFLAVPAALAATALLGAAEVSNKAVLPVEGNPESGVKVIVYEDLQCPDCANFRRMTDEQLLPRFGSRVAVIHKDFPLAKHAWARPAAIAGRYFAAVDAGLAVRYRQWVMARIREITPETFRAKLGEFAKFNSVDSEAAVRALDDPALAALVERDVQEGVARGVVKTPTVFVNGKPFIERFSFDDVAAAIGEALK